MKNQEGCMLAVMLAVTSLAIYVKMRMMYLKAGAAAKTICVAFAAIMSGLTPGQSNSPLWHMI